RERIAGGGIVEAGAIADFPARAPAGTPMPTIGHTGGYVIATGDADLIQQDVILNVVGSFFGVLALFLYAFRRAASIGYAAAPMALGLALTFGSAAIIYGQLSSLSSGFAG